MSHEIIENQHLAKRFVQQVGDPGAVIAAVEKCLEIFPPGKILIHLCETDIEAREHYWSLYKVGFSGRSFVKKSTDTIYVSVQRKWFQSSLQEVFAHEVAHVLLELHFSSANLVPYWMHEHIAQYATTNFKKYL